MKKNIFAILLCVVVLVFFLTNTKKYISSIEAGAIMFCTTIFPALFPFMVISSLLSSLGAGEYVATILHKPMRVLFKSPKSASLVFFLATISGNPVGAKLLAENFEQNILTTEECKRIFPYCSCVSPIFVVGTVGTLAIGNLAVGYAILCIHLVSAILCGIVCNFRLKPSQNMKIAKQNFQQEIFSTSISNSLSTLLVVGGIVTLFYMLIDMLLACNIFLPQNTFLSQNDVLSGFLIGFFEITRGIMYLNALPISLAQKSYFAVILISFGGLCINSQCAVFLKKCKIKIADFLKIKIFQSTISAFLGLIFFAIF